MKTFVILIVVAVSVFGLAGAAIAAPDALAKTGCDTVRFLNTARLTGSGAIDAASLTKAADAFEASTVKAVHKLVKKLRSTSPATQVAGLRAAAKTCNKVAPAPIFTQTGSGTATTGKFKVPSDWDLAWTFDCSKFGFQGNFIVTIYDYYGQNSQIDFDNQGVNQLGMSGASVDHYHSGGNTKYFQITSECDWSVTVTKA